MFIEIKIALNFLLSYLYDKLPRRRVNLLGEELEKYLKLKLLSTNWPVNSASSTPSTTTTTNNTNSSNSTILATCLNESRSFYLNKNDLFIESCLILASNESAMDIKEILSNLPEYLKLFIEPGLVAYLLEPFDFNNKQASNIKLEKYLKILYKLPQIDVNTLDYVSSNSSIDFLQLLSPNKPTQANSSLNMLLNNLTLNEEPLPVKRQIKNVNLKTSSTDSSDLWSPTSSSSSSCSSSSTSLSASNLKLKLFDLNLAPSPEPPVSVLPSPVSESPINGVFKPANSLFTPAEFAQTKFGSTKSKTSFNPTSKQRPHQNSHQHQSTQYQALKYNQQANNKEFAAYIKQKAALQQQQMLKSPTSPSMTPFVGLNRQGMVEDYLETDQSQLAANILLSNFFKANMFETKSPSPSSTSSSCSTSSSSSVSCSSSCQVPHSQFENFNLHNQTFDLIVSSTIKEMIDNYDDDESTTNGLENGLDESNKAKNTAIIN